MKINQLKESCSKEFPQSDYHAIEFSNEMHPRIKIHPMYFAMGFSSSPHIFGRRAVLERLLKAIEFIPPIYGFLIWDVYRPRQVQTKLFEWMKNEIRKKSPHLNEQENYDEARKYAAPPSKVGEAHCSPHLSGGAIDLTLYEIATHKELDMGTVFDDCTELAHRDYLEKKLQLSADEENIKKRRQLLRLVMESVGFVSYQYEWWHFDIGDMLWSRATGSPVLFGPLFGDEEWPSH